MKKLDVLHLEDSPVDAEVIHAVLLHDEIECNMVVVDSSDSFISALENNDFDLILADYTLPGFDGLTALQIARNMCPRTPFIIISGIIGEELAVEALKSGATDYVLKRNLSRLSPVVRRALTEVEEKKKIADLEEEHERFVTVIEQTSEYVIITDIKGNILYVNPAFELNTGYKKEDSAGKHISIFKSNELDDIFYENVYDTIKGGNVWSGHITAIKKDGTSYISSGSINPVRNKNGEIINYVFIFRDVTKEIVVEEQSRQSQKLEAIGIMAGGIAHDFNNILAAIMGYSELLESYIFDSRSKGFLGQVLKSCNRAKDLIKQILTFCRQGEEERKPLHIAPVIKEIMKFIRSSLPATIEINESIVTRGAILADPTRIHQVVMNLCTNSAYAMREKGGILTIRLSEVDFDGESVKEFLELKEGKYIRLTVSDTGHGMDKKTVERIFEPFYTTKPKGEGTGLGLSVVHGIVKSYGGTSTVRSEPEKGSTFDLFFPCVEVDVMEECAGDKDLQGGDEHILLVDDEESLAMCYSNMLLKLGYNVTYETASIKALKNFCLKPGKYDLIITDYTMPKMTGFELSEELLKINPHIPVIIYTGSAEMIELEKYRITNVKEIILKPVPMRVIAQTVRKVLDVKRKE
ncbi:MAG: response regulator [Candidatus Eremiobacterota bacterium]